MKRKLKILSHSKETAAHTIMVLSTPHVKFLKEILKKKKSSLKDQSAHESIKNCTNFLMKSKTQDPVNSFKSEKPHRKTNLDSSMEDATQANPAAHHLVEVHDGRVGAHIPAIRDIVHVQRHFCHSLVP
jgi:hypothetical protein